MEKNIVTTSRLGHPINIFLLKEFLAYAMPLMPHAQFGKSRNMPEHEGDTVEWMRWPAPTAQTTPLGETEEPNPVMPSRTTLTAKVVEYGMKTRWSRWLDMTGLTEDTRELVRWLADHYALTIDVLNREMLANTASTHTNSHGSGTGTLLNSTDFDEVVQALMASIVKPITQLMGASTGQGTTPLPASYVGIFDTDLWIDLKACSGYRDVKSYAAPGQAYEGEIGSVDRIRCILTSNGYKNGNYYYCPIIGQDAYGNVKIPSAEKLLGYKKAEDVGEMPRYSVYYWLMNYVCRILDSTKIIAMICTKSA